MSFMSSLRFLFLLIMKETNVKHTVKKQEKEGKCFVCFSKYILENACNACEYGCEYGYEYSNE